MKKMKRQDIKFDEPKFKELVLYISEKCEDDPDFGAVKLNKILFYTDFLAYAMFGKPVTGSEYIALEHGPAPKMLAPIREEMKEKGEIAIRERDRFGKVQVRVVPLREPDLSVFSPDEIALVDKLIMGFCGINATVLSELSHLQIGWQIASPKEVIPYQTVFLANEELLPFDRQRAKVLAQTYSW